MIPSRPPADPAAAKSLEYFRAEMPRPPLHPLEKTLLTLVVAELVFLSWALSGFMVWSQFVSLALCTLALAVSLLPRNNYDSTERRAPLRSYPVRRLVRFPPFWLGLAFLGYMLIQALNPAAAY